MSKNTGRLVVVTTPFLLGNSAGGIAALISLLGYMAVILVGAIMIYVGIKWFR